MNAEAALVLTVADIDALPAAVRLDRAEMAGAMSRTEEGYLRIPAVLAKVGVLTYRSGGKLVRELVPAHVLADPAFLASLENKPVTLEHPPKLLDPKIVGTYRKGVILPPVTFDGARVHGVLQIENEDAIRAAETGEKREVSAGYLTRSRPESGVDPVHGAYDVVRYRQEAGNHVALTSRGRGGRDVALRMDSEGVNVEIEIEPLSKEPTLLALLAGLLALHGLNAADYADEKSAVAAIENKTKKLQQELEDAKKAPTMLAGADEMIARVAEDGATPAPAVKMDAASEKILAANQKKAWEALQAASKDRVRLDSLAADAGIKDTDGVGNRQLRRKIVAHRKPELKMDSLSDDYVRAHIDLLPKAASPMSELTRAADANLKSGVRMDAADTRPKTPSAASRGATFSSSKEG